MAQQWRCLASLVSPRPCPPGPPSFLARLRPPRLRPVSLFCTLQANPRPQNTISYVLDIRPQLVFNHSLQAIPVHCPSQEQYLVHSSRCAILSLCSPNSFAAAMKKSDEDLVFPASEYAQAAFRARVQHLPTLITSAPSKSVFGRY
ncbi:hypothetical protein B0H14DRAFT_3502343 [Mycena olivaceomarginata]|nr:hypothetical protein B0H14DRAFT_3502343 [Mycena olivaceomarginata]